MIITNAAPQKQGTLPSSYSIIHGKNISIELGSYYSDADGYPLQLTATYSRDGGASLTVPTGIFTLPYAFVIWVNSTGIVDVGTYEFTLAVTDGLVTLTDIVTLTITNQDPVLLKPFSDLTVRQYSSASYILRDYFKDDDDAVG